MASAFVFTIASVGISFVGRRNLSSTWASSGGGTVGVVKFAVRSVVDTRLVTVRIGSTPSSHSAIRISRSSFSTITALPPGA